MQKSLFHPLLRTSPQFFVRLSLKCISWTTPKNFIFLSAALVIQNTWPSGSYGLPKPKSGCPNKQWREGFRYQDSENVENTNLKTNRSNLSGQVNPHGIRQEFCIHMDTPGKRIPWPRGKYCIYRKGKTCPTGLQEGKTMEVSHLNITWFENGLATR